LLLSLDLDRFEFPYTVAHNGNTFALKKEFHVTMIGSRNNIFCDEKVLSLAHSMGFPISFEPTVRLATRAYDAPKPHIRKSLILMCTVIGASDFYAKLGQMTNTQIPKVPHHVTLYTLEGGDAIGIPTEEDLDACSAIVPIETLPRDLVASIKKLL
jgi:hypothetical protein